MKGKLGPASPAEGQVGTEAWRGLSLQEGTLQGHTCRREQHSVSSKGRQGLGRTGINCGAFPGLPYLSGVGRLVAACSRPTQQAQDIPGQVPVQDPDLRAPPHRHRRIDSSHPRPVPGGSATPQSSAESAGTAPGGPGVWARATEDLEQTWGCPQCPGNSMSMVPHARVL